MNIDELVELVGIAESLGLENVAGRNLYMNDFVEKHGSAWLYHGDFILIYNLNARRTFDYQAILRGYSEPSHLNQRNPT